jgi:hypothetical protein
MFGAYNQKTPDEQEVPPPRPGAQEGELRRSLRRGNHRSTPASGRRCGVSTDARLHRSAVGATRTSVLKAREARRTGQVKRAVGRLRAGDRPIRRPDGGLHRPVEPSPERVRHRRGTRGFHLAPWRTRSGSASMSWTIARSRQPRAPAAGGRRGGHSRLIAHDAAAARLWSSRRAVITNDLEALRGLASRDLLLSAHGSWAGGPHLRRLTEAGTGTDARAGARADRSRHRRSHAQEIAGASSASHRGKHGS